jgi:hypothetical protein
VLGFLQRFAGAHSSELALDVARKATLNQLEEITADLGAYARVVAGLYVPNNWLCFNLIGFQSLARAYAMKLGRPGWLGKLVGERLVLPDALLPSIRASIGNLVEDWNLPELPEEWRLYSEQTMVPLSMVLNFDLLCFRDGPLDEDQIREACLSLGFVADPNLQSDVQAFKEMKRELARLGPAGVPTTSDQEATVAAEGGWFSDEQVQKASIHLCIEELKALLGNWPKEGTPGYITSISRLVNGTRLYPWNHLLAAEIAVRTDVGGDSRGALEWIVRAIYLNPMTANYWQSFAVILGKLGRKDDSIFCSAIESMIRERDRI